MSDSNSTNAAPARDQRPFHICPDCHAHNAKFNATCWRCNRDMSAGGLAPKGVAGFRLEQLANEKPGNTA